MGSRAGAVCVHARGHTSCVCVCVYEGVFACCAMLQLLIEKILGEGTEWAEQQQWGLLKSLRQWLVEVFQLVERHGDISAF